MFSYSWVLRALCKFWIHVFYQVCSAKISHSVAFLFILLKYSSTQQKFLILLNPSYEFFFFMEWAFGIVCKNLLRNSWPPKFYHIFSAISLFIFYFTFRSMLCFELILWEIFVYVYIIVMLTTIFYKDCSFSIEWTLVFHQRLVDYICVGLNLGSSFCYTDLCFYSFTNTVLCWLLKLYKKSCLAGISYLILFLFSFPGSFCQST